MKLLAALILAATIGATPALASSHKWHRAYLVAHPVCTVVQAFIFVGAFVPVATYLGIGWAHDQFKQLSDIEDAENRAAVLPALPQNVETRGQK